MGNFEKAHEFTSRWEGGRVGHVADFGGSANDGVSPAALREQEDPGDTGEDGDLEGDFDADVSALMSEGGRRRMRRRFWDALSLDDVKPLCAVVMYDTAVNMGTDCACRLVQKALGLRADGVWGPVTLAALRTCSDRKTAVAVCHLRRARYHELVNGNDSLKPFLDGWLRRVDSLEKTVEAANG